MKWNPTISQYKYKYSTRTHKIKTLECLQYGIPFVFEIETKLCTIILGKWRYPEEEFWTVPRLTLCLYEKFSDPDSFAYNLRLDGPDRYKKLFDRKEYELDDLRGIQRAKNLSAETLKMRGIVFEGNHICCYCSCSCSSYF